MSSIHDARLSIELAQSTQIHKMEVASYWPVASMHHMAGRFRRDGDAHRPNPSDQSNSIHVCGACTLIGLRLSIKRHGLITRMIMWVRVDVGIPQI
jgi:hypothetical protein